VGPGFPPLDEELGLLPGALTPRLHEGLVRLGAEIPFGRAAALFARFTGVPVSEATARRLTEAAGAAAVVVAAAEVARLERAAPPPPPGPAVQQVSVDGAMAPLVGGEWAEVKTLVVGVVADRAGEPGLTAPSYFCRLADHATFTRLALGELHRRGTEAAGTVVGIADGAEWCQGFLDAHRPDAVRILDFPHAVEHLAAAAQAAFGSGTPVQADWLAAQATALKRDGPAGVLAALRALPIATAPDPVMAATDRDGCLAYLERRLGQLEYPAFIAAGYPIGSGAVESANKRVVEARLKGAGMRWARRHVDPVLALRGAVCSDRWDADWPATATELRMSARRRAELRAARPSPGASPVPATAPPPPPRPRPDRAIPCTRASGTPTFTHGRPTAAHPWKRTFRQPPPAPEL